mmetsp:Transcript_8459/g.17939  ORF Transcript_8459/g.17939 Transcript_8459/m.17939 type:complete len:299 (+) Transcript_8459:80-976(+)
MVVAGHVFRTTLGFFMVACLPGAAAVGGKVQDQALAPEVRGRHIGLEHDAALVEQSLVVCNAFAYKKPLDVTRVRSALRLTSNAPVQYKECRELKMPLEEGDQLEFKAGELSVGTFFATGLPKTSQSLLLIPHRKSLNSLNLAFDSHAFSELQSPQIAVVDAYSGTEAGRIQIMDVPKPDEDAKAKTQSQVALVQRVEDLRYNSVIALNPGAYKVALVHSGDNAMVDSSPLNVAGKTKYVVMRVGADHGFGKIAGFPQELVVFPQLAAEVAQSSAPSAMRWNLAAAATALFACLSALL